MAIMIVKIEDSNTLKMNEFFDYNGRCYALSRSRFVGENEAADLEDFYEGTVFSKQIEGVPVVFIAQKEDGQDYICGWYKNAVVYRDVQRPSLFLEGNIIAKSLDAVLLKNENWMPADKWLVKDYLYFNDKGYAVIEDDDMYAYKLKKLLSSAVNGIWPVRYELYAPKMEVFQIKKAKTRSESCQICIDFCTKLASRLMDDACEDIGEIKALREYALKAITFDGKCVDGYYYKAMAEEQLGFIKDGLKSVNKALELESDAADIMALKANLLVAYGNAKEAMQLYQESYEISGDESYLLMKGKVMFRIGDVDGAYKTYRKIADKTLLEEAGINLKDMEKRWPFVSIRGLKQRLKSKHK